MTEDPVQRMLATLYSAPLQPTQWNVFLGQLGEMMGVKKAALLSHDFAKDKHQMVAVFGPQVLESVKVYEEYYHQFDEWTRRFPVRGVPGKVMRGEQVWLDAELLRSTFYNEFLKPFGTRGLAAVAIGRAPAFDALSIYHGPLEEPFSKELLEQLQAFVPHLEIALSMRRRLENLEAQVSSLESALDGLESGIVLIDREGRCIFANKVARRILDERDGLLLERQVLSAQSIAEAATLRAALLSARSAPMPLSSKPAAMLISRLGRKPLSLLAAPLRAESMLVPARAVAIVLIRDREMKTTMPAEALAMLYDLTPAEARLALTLLDGNSLAEAADQHKIAEQTARTQLKKIFQKTSTRRQGELIRLLAGIAATFPLRSKSNVHTPNGG
jgi:DNA-binding CsgD family transcriptional regulator